MKFPHRFTMRIMISRLTVAAIQVNACENRADNLTRALKLCQEAIETGAKFLALPELFNYRGVRYEGESIPGPSLLPLLELAKRHNVWILAGSICETSPTNPTKFYNSSAVISPAGIDSIYRKIHLFNAQINDTTIQESSTFIPGQTPTITPILSIPTGLSICFDLRFSDLFATYSQRGAKMITVPSSFTTHTGEVHWEILLRARAIESQCYIIAPNQTGKNPQGVETYGNSMIVDPWGKILARASQDKPEVITATLDFDYLDTIRQRLPIYHPDIEPLF